MVGATLPGAGWQRCRTHYLRDLLTTVPKSARRWVATMVRTVFDRPAGRRRGRRQAAAGAEHLAGAREDLLVFTGFPRECWRQIWTTTRKSG